MRTLRAFKSLKVCPFLVMCQMFFLEMEEKKKKEEIPSVKTIRQTETPNTTYQEGKVNEKHSIWSKDRNAKYTFTDASESFFSYGDKEVAINRIIFSWQFGRQTNGQSCT